MIKVLLKNNKVSLQLFGAGLRSGRQDFHRPPLRIRLVDYISLAQRAHSWDTYLVPSNLVFVITSLVLFFLFKV